MLLLGLSRNERGAEKKGRRELPGSTSGGLKLFVCLVSFIFLCFHSRISCSDARRTIVICICVFQLSTFELGDFELSAFELSTFELLAFKYSEFVA